MNSLALALSWAAGMAANERNPAEVDRFASNLIELSTRDNFVFWLAIGTAWRGWARSASSNTAEGIPVNRARNKRLSGNWCAAIPATFPGTKGGSFVSRGSHL
jgi:hypothetical protein